jgi:ubiquitin carboxyl-terminal hydrolase 36/42
MLNRCKSYEKAKKKMAVSEAPNVLTIALKRFRVYIYMFNAMQAKYCTIHFVCIFNTSLHVLQSGKYGKLNKPVPFPEILDLAPFMSGTSDLAIYRLYGVVVHLDTMNASYSGHYVCYVKNFQNSWFKIDDSVVCVSFP